MPQVKKRWTFQLEKEGIHPSLTFLLYLALSGLDDAPPPPTHTHRDKSVLTLLNEN